MMDNTNERSLYEITQEERQPIIEAIPPLAADPVDEEVDMISESLESEDSLDVSPVEQSMDVIPADRHVVLVDAEGWPLGFYCVSTEDVKAQDGQVCIPDYAGFIGKVKPRWVDGEWAETATVQEIASQRNVP